MGLAAAALMVGGSAFQAYSQYQSGQWNKRANDIMAADAIQRGQFGETYAKMRGTQMIGQNTAAAAGSGVDVQSGSVVGVNAGTAGVSALDAAMARFNARREAYGYQVRGSIAEAEADNAAAGTLLTGFGSAATSMYRSGAFNPRNGSTDSAPYFLAAPGASYDPSTMPTFVRG